MSWRGEYVVKLRCDLVEKETTILLGNSQPAGLGGVYGVRDFWVSFFFIFLDGENVLFWFGFGVREKVNEIVYFLLTQT